MQWWWSAIHGCATNLLHFNSHIFPLCGSTQRSWVGHWPLQKGWQYIASHQLPQQVSLALTATALVAVPNCLHLLPKKGILQSISHTILNAQNVTTHTHRAWNETMHCCPPRRDPCHTPSCRTCATWSSARGGSDLGCRSRVAKAKLLVASEQGEQSQPCFWWREIDVGKRFGCLGVFQLN